MVQELKKEQSDKFGKEELKATNVEKKSFSEKKAIPNQNNMNYKNEKETPFYEEFGISKIVAHNLSKNSEKSLPRIRNFT